MCSECVAKLKAMGTKKCYMCRVPYEKIFQFRTSGLLKYVQGQLDSMTKGIRSEKLQAFFRIVLLPYKVCTEDEGEDRIKEDVREAISDCIVKHLVKTKDSVDVQYSTPTRELYIEFVECIASVITGIIHQNSENKTELCEKMKPISLDGEVYKGAIAALKQNKNLPDEKGEFFSLTYDQLEMLRRTSSSHMTETAKKHTVALSLILGAIGALLPLSQIQETIEERCADKSFESTCRELSPETNTVKKGKYVGMSECMISNNFLQNVVGASPSCCTENCDGKEFIDNFWNRVRYQPGTYKTISYQCSEYDIENSIPFLSDCFGETPGRKSKEKWEADGNAEFKVTTTTHYASCIPSTGELPNGLQEPLERNACKMVCDPSDHDICASGIRTSNLSLAGMLPMIMLVAALVTKRVVTREKTYDNGELKEGFVIVHLQNGTTETKPLSEIVSTIS